MKGWDKHRGRWGVWDPELGFVPVIAGGMDEFVPDADAFRFYHDGTESGSSPYNGAAENANVTASNSSNEQIHLRYRVQEVGQGSISGGAADDYGLQYQVNGAGGWTTITATSTRVQADTGSSLTDGAATTNRSTNGITDGSGSFVAGEQEDGNAVVEDHQLTANNFTEHVWGLLLVAADNSDADTLTFRMIYNGGNPGMNNTASPVVTISKLTTATGSDSVPVRLTEAMTLRRELAASDTVRVGLTDTLASPEKAVTVSDALPVTASDALVTLAKRDILDSPAVRLDDDSRAPLQSLDTATDTLAVVIGTEASAQTIALAAADTLRVAVTETGVTDTRQLTGIDTLPVRLTETLALRRELALLDTVRVLVTDAADLTRQSSQADTTVVRVDETGTQEQIGATEVTGADTVPVHLTEATELRKELSATDTVAVRLTEASAQTISLSATETVRVRIADAVQLQGFGVRDDVTVQAADALVTLSKQNISDTMAVRLTETGTQSVPTIDNTGSDSVPVRVTETQTSLVSSTRLDTVAVRLTEVMTVRRELSATDTLTVQVLDVATLERRMDAADTVPVHIAIETSDIQIGVVTRTGQDLAVVVRLTEAQTSLLTATELDTVPIGALEAQTVRRSLEATDTLAVRIGVTETTAVSVTITAADTVAVRIDETLPDVRVEANATDTLLVGLLETATQDRRELHGAETLPVQTGDAVAVTVQLPATDTTPVRLIETGTQETLTGATDVTASDTLAVGVLEVYPHVFITETETRTLHRYEAVPAGTAEQFAQLSKRNLTDAVTVRLTESSEALVDELHKDRGDAVPVRLQESAARDLAGAVVVAASDTVSVVITDAFAPPLDRRVVDDVQVVLSEPTEADVFLNNFRDDVAVQVAEVTGGTFERAASDTAVAQLTDALEQKAARVSDTARVGLVDGIDTLVITDKGPVDVTLNAADTVRVRVATEPQESLLTSAQLDTVVVRIGVTETVTETVTLSRLDAVAVGLLEQSQLTVLPTPETDDAVVRIAEAARADVFIAGQLDATSVQVDEVQTTKRDLQASDALHIGILQQTDLDITTFLDKNIFIRKTERVRVVEAHELRKEFPATDAPAVRLAEQSAAPLVTLAASDALAVQASETSDLAIFANVLQASDTVRVGVDDQVAAELHHLLLADSVAVGVDDSMVLRREVPASDTVRVQLLEGLEATLALAVSDAAVVQVDDVGTLAINLRDFAQSDVVAVGVAEDTTLMITQLGPPFFGGKFLGRRDMHVSPWSERIIDPFTGRRGDF